MQEVIEEILHDYPYPIAKCYERLVGSRDTTERWNCTRYLLEVTLKYCACIAITRYIQNDNLDDKTNAALTCLSRPSLGHWLNLFIRCAKRNQEQNQSFFLKASFASSQDIPCMVEAHRAMVSYKTNRQSGATQSLTIVRFMETWVAYRNRTSGHGAPSADHIKEIAPILERAAVELLTFLTELKSIQLIYVSDINLERTSYIHSLTRLMGTTQVPMPHYVSDVNEALVGQDKQLFLSEEGQEKPIVSLHPLAIYSRNEVYLLHHSDLTRSVDYICHHSGQFYSADRIYEDFRDKLGAFFDSSPEASRGFEPVDLYKEAVKMSLIDGELSAQEHEYLLELRGQLGLQDSVADAIEERISSEMQIDMSVAQPVTTPASRASKAAPVTRPDSAEEPKRLLFFSYASVDDSFWGGLVARFSSAAYRRECVLSLVATDPADHHDVSAMSNLVADIDRIVLLHKPDVILMVPFPSETFSQLFEKRFRGLNIPVITVDTEFVGNISLGDDSLRQPSAVLLDNAQGGVLAADALLEAREQTDKPPRYLVLPGLDSAVHSQARVDGFTERVKQSNPDARIRVLPEGRFDRNRARRILEDFLEDVDISRYDGIFCCNDNMALGVYEAFLNNASDNEIPSKFSIVGFNNTYEFQSVMHIDPHNLLLASIDQSLDNYSSTIFANVDAIFAGKEFEERQLIAPVLAPR